MFQKPVIKQIERKYLETQTKKNLRSKGILFYDNLKLPSMLTRTTMVQDESSVNIVVGNEKFVMEKRRNFLDKETQNRKARSSLH